MTLVSVMHHILFLSNHANGYNFLILIFNNPASWFVVCAEGSIVTLYHAQKNLQP